jgi:hypothetical protein
VISQKKITHDITKQITFKSRHCLKHTMRDITHFAREICLNLLIEYEREKEREREKSLIG